MPAWVWACLLQALWKEPAACGDKWQGQGQPLAPSNAVCSPAASLGFPPARCWCLTSAGIGPTVTCFVIFYISHLFQFP